MKNETILIRRSVKVLADSWRYTTNIAPDQSRSVETRRYGQVLSTERFDANGQSLEQLTWFYDPHGRVAGVGRVKP